MSSKTHKITMADWLKFALVRMCRVHFVFVAAYVVYTVSSDLSKLITPQLVFQRWTISAVLLVGVVIIWYLARSQNKHTNYYRSLIYALIMLDLAMATFNIYTQRGMASRAVALFALPILVSSLLLRRSAVFLVATLSAAFYSVAAMKYFVDFFNEGYKAELYIEIGFYCAFFFILASMLSILVKFSNPEAEDRL